MAEIVGCVQFSQLVHVYFMLHEQGKKLSVAKFNFYEYFLRLDRVFEKWEMFWGVYDVLKN